MPLFVVSSTTFGLTRITWPAGWIPEVFIPLPLVKEIQSHLGHVLQQTANVTCHCTLRGIRIDSISPGRLHLPRLVPQEVLEVLGYWVVQPFLDFLRRRGGEFPCSALHHLLFLLICEDCLK